VSARYELPPGELDRREKILWAAEFQFALNGYHGTTLRGIAEEADVKLSLLMYHFKAKLDLYREIFARRQYVNVSRVTALEAIADLSAPTALDEIVAAFANPVLELHENPRDLWFARLVLREASDPSSHERGILQEFFDPMAGKFIDALRRAVPGRSEEFYPWAYLFAVGALTQSSFDVRIRDLAPAVDVDAKYRLLRGFIRAGWEASERP